MTITLQTLIVPTLDHDAMMLAQFGRKISANGRLERRIVAALCAHMVAAGWVPFEVYDGEEHTPVQDAKSAMELIFNLDDAFLSFTNGATSHWVRLIMGNGCDIISDWSLQLQDRDGFNAVMEAFDAETFA